MSHQVLLTQCTNIHPRRSAIGWGIFIMLHVFGVGGHQAWYVDTQALKAEKLWPVQCSQVPARCSANGSWHLHPAGADLRGIV